MLIATLMAERLVGCVTGGSKEKALPDEDVLQTRAAFMAEMEQRGVSYVGYSHGHVRALTHYGIERADIEHALAATRQSLAAIGLAAAGA